MIHNAKHGNETQAVFNTTSYTISDLIDTDQSRWGQWMKELKSAQWTTDMYYLDPCKLLCQYWAESSENKQLR